MSRISKHGGWWATKVRQVGSHVRAQVTPTERAALAAWLSPSQLELFDAMLIADRRHGLDVVAALKDEGVREPDVLLAGLLHDAGKGSTGLLPRVAYSIGQAYGSWFWRLTAVVPGMRAGLDVLAAHAESSARLAEAAGCPPRTVALIRDQEAPRDAEYGELLRLADEAS